MELGNMIFGNSRGEWPIPRTDKYSAVWSDFCDSAGFDGYGFHEKTGTSHFENDVFAINTYDWDAECDCGTSDKMEAWHGQHQHSDVCYQSRLNAAMHDWDEKNDYARLDAAAFAPGDRLLDGMDTEVSHQSEIYAKLCRDFSLPKMGCALHCTCFYNKSAEAYWVDIGGHAAGCRLTRPNFLFKPDGFCINWYKYPFRDSYASRKVSPSELSKMLKSCAKSML